ncbi:NADH-quinone oxidoreductase subunit NuoK [Candidatus Bathyarchaeota archaeon]|nr:MAG: NADH-quinone oxidoreductase subunit NuoK [Candidatus Bathyarchaeota archaeon]
MNMLDCYVMFSTILFIIGVYCLTTKRNMIRMILGIEILINAANLNFIVFSAFRAAGFIDPLGHSIVIVSVGLAGCVTAVALAITIHAYKHYGTIDIRRLSRLRG